MVIVGKGFGMERENIAENKAISFVRYLIFTKTKLDKIHCPR